MYNTSSRAVGKVHAKAGFTLMEMIIVGGLIMALLAWIVPMINRQFNQANVKKTQTTLIQIQQAVELFYNDMQEYPESLKNLVQPPADETLRANWVKGGYLPGKTVPKDPWGFPYQYKRTPEGAAPFDVWSYGGKKGKNEDKNEWIRPPQQ